MNSWRLRLTNALTGLGIAPGFDGGPTMKPQILQRVACNLAMALLAGGTALPVAAQARDGFYGGISIREARGVTSGIAFGSAAVGPVAAPEEPASQQRMFGGYRWRNDIAVEAGFARNESYALKPFGTGAPGGVGLSLGGSEDAALRPAWNVDVVGSYTFLRSFALYGRLAYAQSEAAQGGAAGLLGSDARRTRDGVNVGVGFRYDVTRALGVNLEYTRFGRFAFDSVVGTLPDQDQLRLGVQLRF